MFDNDAGDICFSKPKNRESIKKCYSVVVANK